MNVRAACGHKRSSCAAQWRWRRAGRWPRWTGPLCCGQASSSGRSAGVLPLTSVESGQQWEPFVGNSIFNFKKIIPRGAILLWSWPARKIIMRKVKRTMQQTQHHQQKSLTLTIVINIEQLWLHHKIVMNLRSHTCNARISLTLTFRVSLKYHYTTWRCNKTTGDFLCIV